MGPSPGPSKGTVCGADSAAILPFIPPYDSVVIFVFLAMASEDSKIPERKAGCVLFGGLNNSICVRNSEQRAGRVPLCRLLKVIVRPIFRPFLTLSEHRLVFEKGSFKRKRLQTYSKIR